MKMVDFDYEETKYNRFINPHKDEATLKLQFMQKYVKLYAFKQKCDLELCCVDENAFYLKLIDETKVEELINIEIKDAYEHHLSELQGENEILNKENAMLKTTIARNEAYIERMQHKGEWRK